MSRYHVPGVAIGILHDGDEDIAAYGVTNLEHPLPVDADTLFQIASITKTMTATVVMRLVERGALDLDAPIRRYLPEFKLRDEGAKPEADVLDKLAASEVVAAVEKLPELHREVVLLVDVEGFSYKDAAQTLGVPIGTVMSRLHRARQQLQKSLYDYAVESGIVHASGAPQVPQQ